MSESLRGQFLIAGCKLRDPNFLKTVVLIIEHGPEGAMGLVVNRPSSVSLAHALKGHFELPDNGISVYLGGPVEPAALFIVHNSAELDPVEAPIVPDLYMGSSADVFEEIVQTAVTGNGDLKYRVYCGCAGWGPGQLESELARGDWLLVPAAASYVFDDNPYEVWDELLAAARASKRLINVPCDNPEWN